MIRYHARWIVPISSAPIEHGTVAVDGERIAYVGPRDAAPLGEDYELGNAVLMPGLVNAHCHLELTVMRGFLEDLDFRRWILTLTTARREVLDAAAMLDSARAAIEEGIRAGITTFADTGSSGAGAPAMREYGVRGIMYLEVFGPDPSQAPAAVAELIEKVEAERKLDTALVRTGVSPHAPYTVSDDLFRATARYATRESLPIAVHIAESEMEDRLVAHGSGLFADGLRARGIAVARRATTPIQLLDGLGVLAAHPLLIHCVRVDDADRKTIARAGCAVAHCPISNAKLGHGIAPLVEVMADGIKVGLGTDSVASNNRMHILEEARAALLMQRARLGTHEILSAREMLELATVGGARALGLDQEIGTLEAGKGADLAAFSLDHAAPTYDPVTSAVYSLGGAPSLLTVVAGRRVVERGQIARRDAGLAERIDASAAKLRDWLSRR